MKTPANVAARLHLERRRAERLAREAAVASRSDAAAKVRKDRRDYIAAKAAGTLPNPTATKSIDDFGGYDINGNPL